ncbi:hypothetical protein M885DRAFT_572778, partial [Pelagophyceae sp. CCMP2097]
APPLVCFGVDALRPSEWTPCGAEDAVYACAAEGIDASTGLRRISAALAASRGDVVEGAGVEDTGAFSKIIAEAKSARGRTCDAGGLFSSRVPASDDNLQRAAKVPRVEEPDLEEQCDAVDAVDATQDDSDDDTDEIDAADEAAGSEAVS